MNAVLKKKDDVDGVVAAAASGRLVPMRMGDLDAVMALEQQAYAVPWTRGNFIDSLAMGHPSFLLLSSGCQGEGVLGYVVSMRGVDELHLLNLTVAPAHHGKGWGQFLLRQLVALARREKALQVLLEVRQSNERARALYLRHDFVEVGVRRGYYPLPAGMAGREDAVVMALTLTGSSDGGASHEME